MSADRGRAGAVAYIRTSSDEQDLSPDAQLNAITAWGAARGVPILEVYQDLDVSSQAPVAKRPGLPLAIDAVRRLRAAYLVAAVSDRFHRKSSVGDEIRSLTALAGGRVVTADGVEDGNSEGPAAWLITKILDLVSEYEVMMIRARTRRALDVRRRQGLVIGSVPLGYQAHTIGRTDEGKPIRQIKLDPREAAAAAVAVELRRQGMGLPTIGRELVARGFPPRGKRARETGRWHPQSVERLLERAPDLLAARDGDGES